MGQDTPDNVICEDGVCRVVTPAEAAAHAAGAAGGTPLAQLLGTTLTGQAAAQVATSTLQAPGKLVGLYFSAHWCGPCRNFTPKLAEWYTKFKAGNAHKDDLEIVFVSSDKDEPAFDEYYATMPWLALPYSERDKHKHLNRTFKVRGIPSLIILDAATGEVSNGSGDDIVRDDPEGANFPWRPKSFAELLGDGLVDKEGKTHTVKAALDGKVKLLYFSAHWCPPCRGFTPELVKSYAALKAAGKNFETVFISSDRDEESFKGYLGEMPWLALPFEARAAKAALSSMFEVQGIPTLVILDENNQLITTNGRSYVSKDPVGADFPWHPKPLDELDEDGVDAVNEGPVLILLLDDQAEAAAASRSNSVLLEIATAERAAKGPVAFRWGLRSAMMPGKVLEFLKDKASLELGTGDSLLLTDLTSKAAYLCGVSGAALTAAEALAFFRAYKAGSLTPLKFA